MKEQFICKTFTARSKELIGLADGIVAEYAEQGFKLTLRQLYYQFVARDFIENSQRAYKNLGTLINNARLAGLIDWSAIEDRTRNLESNAHWTSPADILDGCAAQFRFDLWDDQCLVPEVWIEKEALTGVIEGVCQQYDVAFFACRGYVSASEQWRAYQRILHRYECNQRTVILHLGDLDPSGLDMTRDNGDRLTLFLNEFANAEDVFSVRRLALNMNQVEQYNPPPNPAKITDSRFKTFHALYGSNSWELDALEPSVINGLIESEIQIIVDGVKFTAAEDRQRIARRELARLADDYRADHE